MNNKITNKLAVFSIFIIAILISTSTQINAAVDDSVRIDKAPFISVIDSQGNIISGDTSIIFKNIIPANYTGVNLLADTTAIVDGVESPLVRGKTYYKDTILKTKNVGSYRGKKLVHMLKLNNSNKFTTSPLDTGITPIPSGNIPNPITYEVWLEYEDGSQLDTSNGLKILYPAFSNRTYYNATYMTHDLYTVDKAGNMVKPYGLLFGGQTSLDNTIADKKNFYEIIFTGGNIAQNVLIPADQHYFMRKEQFNGTYPNGTHPTKSVVDNSTKFLNADATIFIPLDYPSPNVQNTLNEDTFQAELNIDQSVYLQSNDSFYPDNLEINVKTPTILETVKGINNLKLTDSNGNDITSKVQISSPSNGNIKIIIPKSLLKELKDNNINIKYMIDINRDNNLFLNYLNKKTGLLTFSSSASNNVNDISSDGYIQVKMPGPTGEAIPTTVSLNSTTNDLDARSLVWKLNSILEDDTVTVVGFKEEKKFSTVGSDSVIVQIKSQLTGIVSDIEVPITVTSNPNIFAQARLSWENNSPTAFLKKDEVTVSSLTGNYSTDYYWSTNLKNQRYKVQVSNSDGDIYSESLTTQQSLGDSKWLKETLSIPFDKLKEGSNELRVKIYAVNTYDKPIGGFLAFLDLDIKVNLIDALQVEANNLDFGGHLMQPKNIYASTIDDSFIKVTEGSGKKTGWKLKAQMQNFQSESGNSINGVKLFYPNITPTPIKGNSQPNVLPLINGQEKSFIDDLSGKILNDDNDPIYIAKASAGTGDGMWQLNYQDKNKIQINIPSSQLIGSYTSTLLYTLEDSP